jgi:hypothetical protein
MAMTIMYTSHPNGLTEYKWSPKAEAAMINDKHTSKNIEQTGGYQRPWCLFNHSTAGQPICCDFLQERTVRSKDMGELRRNSVVASTSDRVGCLLGRTTSPSGLLQGDDVHDIIRPNAKILMPASSRGLILFTGDSANSSADQSESMPVKLADKSLYNQLAARLHNIKATQALNYLHYVFSHSDAPIMVNSVFTSPDALKNSFPGLDFLRACDVGPMKFYGGPPNQLGWYYGSLLSLLQDQILSAYFSNRQDLVGRFLNTEM